jgi:penicillin amidase
MRMVVNLGDLDKSKWINLTGASGHAYSAHYTDQTDKWVEGELLPWNFTGKAVDGSTGDTLVLKP